MLLECLNKLGTKLGIVVGETWPWFMKQQYIEPCQFFILLGAILLAFCFVTKFTKTHYSIFDSDYTFYW